MIFRLVDQQTVVDNSRQMQHVIKFEAFFENDQKRFWRNSQSKYVNRVRPFARIDNKRIVTFQFQHGTIERAWRSPRRRLSAAFQFQHGTIERGDVFVLNFAKHISIPTWYD